MSSGKIAVVRLSPEAQRRLELERATRALEEQVARWRILAEYADELRRKEGSMIPQVTVPVVDAASEPADVWQQVSELAAAHSDKEVELAASVVSAAQQRIVERLESTMTAKAVKRTSEPATRSLNVETLQKLRTLSGRLNAEATGAERESVEILIERIRTAKGMRAKALLLELRARLQEIDERVHRAVRQRDEVATLRLPLLGCDCPERDDLLVLLAQAAHGEIELDDPLREAVTAALEQAKATTLATAVANAAEQAFRTMGYEVHRTFVERLASGQAGYARRTEWQDHAIRLSLVDGRVRWETVRTRSLQGGVEVDMAAQEDSCTDYQTFIREITGRGLRADRLSDSEIPPGVFASDTISVGDARHLEFEENRHVEAPRAKEFDDG